jgi:hypothetical protein
VPETLGTAEVEQRSVFDQMLVGLADSMRQYDALAGHVELLVAEEQSFEDTLSALDNKLLNQYPQDIAYSALGVMIARRRIEPIKQKMGGLLRLADSVIVREQYGKKVTVTSLEPGRYNIGSSRMNKYGEFDRLSQWHTKRSGRITALHLDVLCGGSIMVRELSGMYYSADPLIDRYADYAPAFTIVNK